MNFNLDFTIETSKARKAFIESQDLSTLTKTELQLCANYILYGKDEDQDFTSCVDRKEVFIKPKFSSYSKKDPVSLDALMESPAFTEAIFQQNPTIYKKVKPQIDRDKAKLIPGMEELWVTIQNLENVLKNEKLTSKQKYYLNHQLIDLRRQQYKMIDSVFPTLPPAHNRNQYYTSIQDTQLNYPIYPRGIMGKKDDPLFKFPFKDERPHITTDIQAEIQALEEKNKPYFSFLNKEHVYFLILNYWDICAAIEKIPDSPLWNLIWTLDFYIEKANLNPQQSLIVRDKKFGFLNKEIAAHLLQELGISHQENYISTIWNKSVQLIIAAAELNYDEWAANCYEKAWKRCNCCGRLLLRDSRNFVRKERTKDGLTNTCKCCDKKKRKKKEGK